MNREAISQGVFDELGVILVDKSEIHMAATFDDLAMDQDDIEKLLDALQTKFKVEFPDSVKLQTTPLTQVIDTILLIRRETLPDDSKSEGL
ncbi:MULTISPECIES: hypothetical protein [Pseudomonas syringae group]|uniref:Carrier domain-containing protein n=3 Tax=Pseudomonas syringae group TaxID=136849 RepID=A0AA40NYA2_9PSED|nr:MULTISPECIES: hypothetical protein [Pseudomonas syringae group]KGS11158.1 hypothetical protein OA77_28655 [Pseudomonas coronafaciens]KOP55405.1 hypothetical protein OX88_13725 [Pseudomonas coronafaciens pv. porri]KOP55925.1 hypothetical protein OX90_17995 [Pseudomonas coronafaciens pv. porri]KPX33174.1 Uncharacterized protein ALO77_01387 [Pseudomonas coronafaciens pv. garcae]KPY15158.1 Uncharacterized protein ALO89_01518 [Pseudomonas coronafaciens pv. porri]